MSLDESYLVLTYRNTRSTPYVIMFTSEDSDWNVVTIKWDIMNRMLSKAMHTQNNIELISNIAFKVPRVLATTSISNLFASVFLVFKL